jgi:hypothetical protein
MITSSLSSTAETVAETVTVALPPDGVTKMSDGHWVMLGRSESMITWNEGHGAAALLDVAVSNVVHVIVYGERAGTRAVRLALQTRVAAPQVAIPVGPETSMDTVLLPRPLT